MSWLRQTFSITAMNVLSIRQRWAASVVSIIGVAAVVGVFSGVLSMANGFERTMISAGSDDTVVIVRAGSTGELASGLSNETVQVIASAPGIRRVDDTAMISAELYVVVDVAKKSTNESANVPLRGVQPSAFDVRDNVEIVDGRMFDLGKNEFVVGRGAQNQFSGLEVGSIVPFGLVEWTVVGVFADGGSASESELWADVRVVQDTYRRGNSYQSVRAKLTSGESLGVLTAALEEDPRVDVDVSTERDFYSRQAESLSTFIRVVGYPLTVLMAFGAIFGALNTMYSSVSARSKEIATLRSIGFGPMPILVSVMAESSLLAIVGGVLGGGLSYLFLNGYTVSTLNGASFSQVVFDFAVSPDLLIQGLVAAVIIGLVGGLFPAIRAVRIPVAVALREL
jgi:putative ABC transport system permease protein